MADSCEEQANQQADTGRGVWVDPSLGKELFGHYARQWLETRSDLEDTTRAKYQGLLRLDVLPAFGSRRIAHIDPAAVRGWYHALAVKYTSTGDDAYRLLQAIMNTAAGDKRIGRVPMHRQRGRGYRVSQAPIATIAELQAAVDALSPRYRAGFALAAWCRLRRGEVLGLQRRHVEMESLTIQVGFSTLLLGRPGEARNWYARAPGSLEASQLPSDRRAQYRVGIQHMIEIIDAAA